MNSGLTMIRIIVSSCRNNLDLVLPLQGKVTDMLPLRGKDDFSYFCVTDM